MLINLTNFSDNVNIKVDCRNQDNMLENIIIMHEIKRQFQRLGDLSGIVSLNFFSEQNIVGFM